MAWWLCLKCRELKMGGWYQGPSTDAMRIDCPAGHDRMLGPCPTPWDVNVAIQQRARQNWKRAIGKALKITAGSFPGGLHVTSPYYLEILDKGHQYGPDHRALYEKWLTTDMRTPYLDWLDTQRDETFKGVLQVPSQHLPKHRITIEKGVIQLDKDFPPDWKRAILAGDADELIFVVDRDRNIYAGLKIRGRFQHTSFIGGRPVRMAGMFVVNQRLEILAITNSSGHYMPGAEPLREFLQQMAEAGVNLATTKLMFWNGQQWTYNGRADQWQ